MQFTKILSATLFAVLATAAPTPASTSVDLGQLAALAQSFQSFGQSTGGGVADLTNQAQSVSSGFSGSSANALQQALSRFQVTGKELEDVAAKIADTLNGAASSYDETESGAESALENLSGELGGP